MTFTAPPAPVVVDASVAVDVLLDELDAAVAWEDWTREGRLLLAPSIFWPEVGQALLRRRWPAFEIASRLRLLEIGGVEATDRGSRGVANAVGLAATHGLSVYDATYLWLAIDVDGELATRDAALAKAAAAEGVPLALEP